MRSSRPAIGFGAVRAVVFAVVFAGALLGAGPVWAASAAGSPGGSPVGQPAGQPATGDHAGPEYGPGQPSDAAGPAPADGRFYVVPPAGPAGAPETLFIIAERLLGAGNRAGEIFNLNQGRLQPDGGRLTSPDFIEPGWVLLLPADARGSGVRAGPLPTFTPQPHPPASSPPPSPPPVPAPVTAAPPQPPALGPAPAGPAADRGLFPPLPPALTGFWSAHGAMALQIGLPLLALALLFAARRRVLAAARALQRAGWSALDAGRTAVNRFVLDGVRRGRDGRTLAALLRDPLLYDLAGRAVHGARAAVAADTGADPTTTGVYGVSCDWRSVTVHLAGCNPPEPPAPWHVAAGGRRWTAIRSDVARLPAPPAGQRPCMVTVGAADGACLLVDLAAAPGVLAVTGDRERAVALVRTIAAQLNRRGVPVAGLADLPEPPAPGTVLCCPEPAPGEADLLPDLAAGYPDLRVVTAGLVRGSRWTFTIAADGSLDTGLLGVRVTACHPDAPAQAPEQTGPADCTGTAEHRLPDPDVPAEAVPAPTGNRVPMPQTPGFAATGWIFDPAPDPAPDQGPAPVAART
jgi:hypothetical protein